MTRMDCCAAARYFEWYGRRGRGGGLACPAAWAREFAMGAGARVVGSAMGFWVDFHLL